MPQDLTEIIKIGNDGLQNKKAIPVGVMASAIRKQYPHAPTDLSDGAVVKQFVNANAGKPGFDKWDDLEWELPSAAAPQPSPTAAPIAGAALPPKGEDPGIWSDLRRGAIKGVAAMADFGANAARGAISAPVEIASRLMTALPGSPHIDPEVLKNAAIAPVRRFAESERAKAETMPPPTSMPGRVAQAVPNAIGVIAPYAALPGGGGALANAARMGTVEALRASDRGPAAAAAAGGTAAIMGGAGFPLVNKLLSPVMQHLPEVAGRFASTALPMTGLSMVGGASPEEAGAEGIAYGLLGVPGGHEGPVERKARGGTAPPPSAPGEPPSGSGGGAVPPGAPPSAPPAAGPRNPKVIETLRREAIANPKERLTVSRLNTFTGGNKAKSGKMMSQLLEDGVIDSFGRILPEGGQAAAPAPTKPGPVAVPKTAAPPAAPPVAGPMPTPAETAAIEDAFGGPPTPPAPPAAAPAEHIAALANNQPPPTPITSRPTADSPESSKVVVNQPPAPPATAPPPTPESIGQQLVGGVRQEAMASQARGVEQPQPPAVLPEVPPTTPAPVLQFPAPAAAPIRPPLASAAAPESAGRTEPITANIPALFHDLPPEVQQKVATGILKDGGAENPSPEDVSQTIQHLVEVSAQGEGSAIDLIRAYGGTPETEAIVNPPASAPAPRRRGAGKKTKATTPPPVDPDTAAQIAANEAKFAETERALAAMRATKAGAGPAAEPVAPTAEDATAAAERLRAKFARINPLTSTPGGERGSFSWKPVPGEKAPLLEAQDFRDLYTVGRAAAQRAGQTFEAWRGEMVNQFGDWVDAHLKPMWENIRGVTAATVNPAIPKTQPPPTGATVGPGAALTPPETAASLAGAALPPSQPPFLQWDQGARPVSVAPIQGPPVENPVTPAEKAANAEWVRNKVEEAARLRAQGGEDVESRRAAAERARAEARPIPPAPPEEKAAPGATVPPMAPVAGINPLPAGPVAAKPIPYIEGKVPPHLEQYPVARALAKVGFTQRGNADAGGTYPGEEFASRPHGRSFRTSPTSPRVEAPIYRELPSGNAADSVWTMPVAEGTIEIQMDTATHEFEATKYYNDGTISAPIHKIGANAMVDYLNGVQAREIPRTMAQSAGRSYGGGEPVISQRITAPPPTPDTPVNQTAADIAQIEHLTRTAATPAEAMDVITNAIRRAATPPKAGKPEAPSRAPSRDRIPRDERLSLAEGLRQAQQAAGSERGRLEEVREPGTSGPSISGPLRTPKVKREIPPEKLAQSVKSLLSPESPPNPDQQNVNPLSKIIAQMVFQQRGQAFDEAAAVRPPSNTPGQGKQPRTRVKPPAESPFKIESSKDGNFHIVTAKAGMDPASQSAIESAFGGALPPGADAGPDAGKVADAVNTGVHIQKVKNNRYEIKIGANDKTVRATSSLSAAKLQALEIADRMLYQEASKNTPFHVPGVGTYAPLGMADGNVNMRYQFRPERGPSAGKTITHEMPKGDWDRLQRSGTPTNPITAPKNPVGRPKTAAPPSAAAPKPARSTTAAPPEMEMTEAERQAKSAEIEARIAELEKSIAAGKSK